jgi:DnaJ-class molecular chaperone
MTDHYAALNISEDSGPSEIKAAYRKMALKWHPDRNESEEAVKKFNASAEAFETLSDPTKKKKYDQQRNPHRKSSSKGGGATVLHFSNDDAHGVFEKLFGKTSIENIIKQASNNGNGNINVIHRQTKTQKPIPIPVKIRQHDPPPPKITVPTTEPELQPDTDVKPLSCQLEDLYTGKRRIVKLDGYTKSVIVEIPAGCEDGHQLSVKNPENGNTSYFSVHAQKHPIYWRIGNHLHMNHEVELHEYINGFKIVITLLDGRKKKISHRYGGKTVGPDLVMKIPNLGMPKFKSIDCGDLFVHFKVCLPGSI